MSTPEPTFVATATPQLYLLRRSLWAGYLRSSDLQKGASFTLSQSYADPGAVWFWTDQAVRDQAAFAASLTTWLTQQPPAAKRLVWIKRADENLTRWQTVSINTTLDEDGQTVVTSGGLFDFNGIQVVVHPGCLLSWGEKEALYGWALTLKGTKALSLLTEEGAFPATRGLAGFSYGETHLGCLVWNMTLAAPVRGQRTQLQQLGVSQRYFCPYREALDGTVAVLRSEPLLQQEDVCLYAAIDPFQPLDTFRSRLSFYLTSNPGSLIHAFGARFIGPTGEAFSLTPNLPGKYAGATSPGFVLATQPLVVGEPGAVPSVHYFTPDGNFSLQAVQPPAPSDGVTDTQPTTVHRLMCGMNGTEYFGFPDHGMTLCFISGQAAFAPNVGDAPTTALAGARLRFDAPDLAGTTAGGGDQPLLTELGTTAWLWLKGPTDSLFYYAQSEAALFYSHAHPTDAFLSFYEMSSAMLGPVIGLGAFPMMAYSGLSADQCDLARVLENEALAPLRLQKVLAFAERGTHDAVPQAVPPRSATAIVSPSGLSLGVSDDDQVWDWLAVGNTGTNDNGLPDLFFTAVQGPFRDALNSNNLFMVLGDAHTVLQSASVAYQLTADDMALLAVLPGTGDNWADVVAAVNAVNSAAGYVVYKTEHTFDQMLDSANPKPSHEQRRIFQKVGGLLTPIVGDWTFRLSPRNWSGPNRQTRFVFKFVTDRSLRALVDDTDSWLWPQACGEDGDVVKVRNQLLRCITDAEASVRLADQNGEHAPFQHFVDVVHDPNWTGVLVFDGEVPLDRLPDPLQPLAAGINPDLFYGHHLGLSATGFKPDGKGGLAFDISSSFGLINYHDPEDQTFDSDTVNFAFKVRELVVAFENGLMTDFTATAQLLVNRLFGTQTQLTPTSHGNNLMLDGVYQAESTDGEAPRGTYRFQLREPGAFLLSQGQLLEVAVDQVRMAVVRAGDPQTHVTTIQTLFQMDGALRFAEPSGLFDPFCWGHVAGTEAGAKEDAGILGHDVHNQTKPEDLDPAEQVPPGTRGLAFANYAISMAFPLADPTACSFGIVDDNLSLDSAHSPPRADSLFARFPLRLVELISSPDPWITEGISPTTALGSETRVPLPLAFSPESAGYVSIAAPIRQGRLSAPWFGLVYEIDLGSLGALAGSVGITLRLLAAWSPGAFENPPAVYVGLALPGVSQAVGMCLPLQGILDLGFRTAQFENYADEAGTQYLLRLRDFAVRVLGWSFPPGHNDIILFGNPDQTSDTKLGWYAAFEDIKVSEKGKKKKRAQPRTVRAARGKRT